VLQLNSQTLRQSILVQANEQWKASTLSLGDFNMDELKKDISSADAKFTRPYKLTSARAIRQGVAPPSFLASADKVCIRQTQARTQRKGWRKT
jgi:hypothetical protein